MRWPRATPTCLASEWPTTFSTRLSFCACPSKNAHMRSTCTNTHTHTCTHLPEEIERLSTTYHAEQQAPRALASFVLHQMMRRRLTPTLLYCWQVCLRNATADVHEQPPRSTNCDAAPNCFHRRSSHGSHQTPHDWTDQRCARRRNRRVISRISSNAISSTLTSRTNGSSHSRLASAKPSAQHTSPWVSLEA